MVLRSHFASVKSMVSQCFCCLLSLLAWIFRVRVKSFCDCLLARVAARVARILARFSSVMLVMVTNIGSGWFGISILSKVLSDSSPGLKTQTLSQTLRKNFEE